MNEAPEQRTGLSSELGCKLFNLNGYVVLANGSQDRKVGVVPTKSPSRRRIGLVGRQKRVK